MNGYYVYVWFNDEWGKVPIYVGKGEGNRYISTRNRSKAFINHIHRWRCHSEIILDGLNEECAMRLEKALKDAYIIEGYPILDAETSYRKKVLQSVAIRNAKARGCKFGRPSIKIDGDFKKFLKKQKDGEMSVSECCEQLGISRATWYNKLREVS